MEIHSEMKLINLLYLSAFFAFPSCQTSARQSYLSPTNAYLAPLQRYSAFRDNFPAGIFVIQVRSEEGFPRIVLRRAPPPNGKLIKGPLSTKTAIRLHQPPLKYAAHPKFTLKMVPTSNQAERGKQPQYAKIKLNILRLPSKYVFRKPFEAEPIVPKNSIIFNAKNIGNHYRTEPIHTILAPNPANLAEYFNNKYCFNVNSDVNQLSQYQVTEESTNDRFLHDKLSGQMKYFAPDPDPSLPVKHIRPSTDPYSMPSGISQLQSNIHSQDGSSNKLTHPPATSYGIPINSASNAVDGVPLSVSNPSYLVSQSKNLYEQHKQQLSFADSTQHINNGGRIVHRNQPIVSNFNPYFVNIYQHQAQNQAALGLANQQVEHQLAGQHTEEYPTDQYIPHTISAYQQHQHLLGQQLN